MCNSKTKENHNLLQLSLSAWPHLNVNTRQSTVHSEEQENSGKALELIIANL
jgi:hypothetical protein